MTEIKQGDAELDQAYELRLKENFEEVMFVFLKTNKFL